MLRITGLLALLALAGCSAHGPLGGSGAPVGPHQAAVASAAGAAEDGATPLEAIVGSAQSDGRVMKLRGTIRNPSRETVRGVRLRLRLLSRAGAGASVLDTQRTDVDAVLEPGGTAPLHWQVESMYLGAAGGGFDLEAYPRRVGERDLPAPPGW